MTLPRRRPLRSLLASAACLAASAFGAAHAQPAQGLPMWVIKDADSTIYMTGTIHMLPPDVKWDSDKLRNAIKDADELWLELPMGSDVMKWAAEAAPIMMRYAVSDTPLTKLLSPEEIAALKQRIADTGLPPETFAVANTMKPWLISTMLGISPLLANGYDAESGIDGKIAKLAEDDGDPIKGFETVEEQSAIISSGAMEEQLAALRKMISLPPAEVARLKEEMNDLALSWAKGDVADAEALLDNMNEADKAQFGGARMDALLLDRNENWAGQIETMLKGKGTHVIAVGAGHLVGPDSVQERLKLRGIATERY